MDKGQEFLRNALERANVEKTAKQLLSKELSEATAARDKLMIDLTCAKQVSDESPVNLCLYARMFHTRR